MGQTGVGDRGFSLTQAQKGGRNNSFPHGSHVEVGLSKQESYFNQSHGVGKRALELRWGLAYYTSDEDRHTKLDPGYGSG